MTNTPAADARRTRRTLRPLFVVALLVCVVAPLALAQSGRRKTDPSRQSPVPTPTPAAAEPQGESESQPRRGAATGKNLSVIATFVVYEDENLELDFAVTGSQRDIVSRTFHERLRQSKSVEVLAGGKATRGTARQHAKKESVAHVVHLQLEEDLLASRDSSRRQDTLGRRDASMYAVRVSVYAPASGDLKYSELIHQRPYRPTARVGGIPVPVPVGRDRIPGEYQLAQAARDAADRLLSRFDIQRPPDN